MTPSAGQTLTKLVVFDASSYFLHLCGIDTSSSYIPTFEIILCPLVPSLSFHYSAFQYQRAKLKCAKAPCFREVSHTLVHFGEKEWHRNESFDACTFSCFILRRYSSDPRPMKFAVFHRKGATGLRVTSP